MSIRKFIVSRATARALLSTLDKNGSVSAPINFRKDALTFEIDQNKIFYNNHELPRKILEDALKYNNSFEINCVRKMEILPLTIPSDEGIIFKLTEPENDADVVGPILYLHNLRMHLTKGFPSSSTFSQYLAEAAKVKKGDRVLDLFFGQGYCTKAALEMGASKVVTFEMYNEVLQLASKNPFSPDIRDPKIICKRRDIINSVGEFFHELGKINITYDACIIDPAKKRVMEKVYSTKFLTSLSDYLAPGANVAAYVPEGGIAEKFQNLREQIVSIFEATTQFSFQGKYKDNEFIYCFRRK